MIKKWSRWMNRGETVLKIGENTYSGRVTDKISDREPVYPPRYYFETDEGEDIEISKKSVRAKDGRLVWILKILPVVHRQAKRF